MIFVKLISIVTNLLDKLISLVFNIQVDSFIETSKMIKLRLSLDISLSKAILGVADVTLYNINKLDLYKLQ